MDTETNNVERQHRIEIQRAQAQIADLLDDLRAAHKRIEQQQHAIVQQKISVTELQNWCKHLQSIIDKQEYELSRYREAETTERERFELASDKKKKRFPFMR